MNYYRFCNDLNSRGILIPEGDNIDKHITNRDKDYYVSIFKYTDEHKKKFETSNTVAGITDVVTSTLLWDFDSSDIEVARKDAIELGNRLKGFGIPEAAIQVYFSGGKGFHVAVNTDAALTPTQFRRINAKIADGLATNDTKVCNASRIIRAPYTKHQKSGLYKIGLSLSDLNENSAENIRQAATSLSNINRLSFTTASLPKEVIAIGGKEPEILNPTVVPMKTITELDFSKRPKFLDESRWALQNGFFEEGERSQALICLAASYKNMGFDLDHTYRLLKGVAEMQAKRSGTERFPDNELYVNVCMQVYGPSWKGGQFSTRDPGSWLHQYVIKWNIPIERAEAVTVSTDQAFGLFENYALNYDKNALKTGIGPIDKKISFMMGTSNGILAAPGVGKSSIAFSLLNHNSKQGVNSIFFSFDMHHSAVVTRLIQKHTGMQQEQIYRLVKDNPKEMQRIKALLREEYKNVDFCFKSGQTAQDIEKTIDDVQDKRQEKVKLIIVDYSELVFTNLSDPTQASAQVSHQLRQIANDKEVCVITLYQPNKANSNIVDEVKSYSAAKGSGAIAQSLTSMLSMSRPGFSPREPELDKFITINALKNRNGSLFSVDLAWDGLKGDISQLDDQGHRELQELRDRLAATRRDEEGGSW